MNERTETRPESSGSASTEGAWLDMVSSEAEIEGSTDASLMERLTAEAVQHGHVFKIHIAEHNMLLPRLGISTEISSAVAQVRTKLAPHCRKHGLAISRYSLYSSGVVEIPLLPVEPFAPRPIDGAFDISPREVTKRAAAAYQSLVECSLRAAQSDIENTVDGAQADTKVDSDTPRVVDDGGDAGPNGVTPPARPPVDPIAQNVLKALGKTGLELRSHTGTVSITTVELSKLHVADNQRVHHSEKFGGIVTSVDEASGYFILNGITPVEPVEKIIWPSVGDGIGGENASEMGRPKALQGIYARNIKIQPRLI